jgi:hypothetical protein
LRTREGRRIRTSPGPPSTAIYQVAQPWMKDYVYQAEFKVLYKKVWLDR